MERAIMEETKEVEVLTTAQKKFKEQPLSVIKGGIQKVICNIEQASGLYCK
jgi:hypothetical protein